MPANEWGLAPLEGIFRFKEKVKKGNRGVIENTRDMGGGGASAFGEKGRYLRSAMDGDAKRPGGIYHLQQ